MMPKIMKETILIVDDEPENLHAIVKLFKQEEENYTILKAPSGQVALDIISKIKPDIIITDWEMPGMSGLDLIRTLKQSADTVDIPVIMCTGVMTTSENLRTALSAGASDYIRKPVDGIELLSRTKANMHLAERYAEIKRLNQTKDKLFSIISHDLRGTFGNIVAVSNLVIEKYSSQMDEDEKILLEHLDSTVSKTSELLENLLKWAQSQMKGVKFNPKVQSIKKFVDNNLANVLEISSKKGVDVIAEHVEDVSLPIDEDILKSILQNLMTNAIKFTPSGGKIEIKGNAVNDHFQLAVVDNGVGMSQEKISALFKLDSKVSTSGTNNEPGTGLGLILCQEMANIHGGKIWVESAPNQGSTFYFAIPMK